MSCDAPLRLILDEDALVANWRWLRKQGGGAACGAAVKANGYGLGARAVATRLAAAGCRDFFCATWAEATALLPLAPGSALSVLHGVRSEDMATALGTPARPVLNSAAQVARWRAAGGGSCDVMVDTGMNRLGLSEQDVRSGLLDGLTITTLMSHLACADDAGHPMNVRQLERFEALRGAVKAERYSLANSAGILLGPAYAFDLTRPGIALYGGLCDAAPPGALRAVASIEAQILQVRDVAVGETVGYGATWTATRPSRVAILNLGYADGVARRLQDRLAARVGDTYLGCAGRISMDLLAIEITAAPVALAEGDWLTLPIDPTAFARGTEMSPYEVLTGLGDRFARHWR